MRELRQTPNGSVTEAKIANGAVTPGKLASGSVGTGAIADSAVGGAQIANGSITAADLGRFWGRFRSTIGPIEIGTCWSGEPTGLPPELAGADISNDLVIVQPDDRFLERRVTFNVRAVIGPRPLRALGLQCRACRRARSRRSRCRSATWSSTCLSAVAAHLHAGAAVLHRAPAAAAVATGVEEQPRAVLARLQPIERAVAQEVESGDGERPQRPLELVAVPREIAADESRRARPRRPPAGRGARARPPAVMSLWRARGTPRRRWRAASAPRASARPPAAGRARAVSRRATDSSITPIRAAQAANSA